MLKILTTPNKVLTTPVKPVKKFDAALKKLVREMDETLAAQVDPQGVGLAATQIGKSIALFIMKPFPEDKTEVILNPKILELQENDDKSDQDTSTEEEEEREQLEGCLSIPRIWSPIKRPGKVLLQFQDVTGKEQKVWYTGFRATIVQHEVDHLNGILFTQRALEQKEQLYEEKGGKLKKVPF